MTTLVVVCSALGLALGPALDVIATRIPRKVPVRAAGAGDEVRPRRAALLGVACAALFAGTAARLHGSWALPAFLVLAATLVVLAVIDLEHYLLPNRIVLPLAGALLVLLTLGGLLDGDIGAAGRAVPAGLVAFASLLVLHLVSPRGMGFGDVKLAFSLGLALGWLGWGELALGFFLGFLYGALAGIALVALRLRNRKDHVPFGPFLAAGTMTAVLWGNALLDWYAAS
jgi:leader peptidase (prepilin peptidase) / N-methyltransferase